MSRVTRLSVEVNPIIVVPVSEYGAGTPSSVSSPLSQKVTKLLKELEHKASAPPGAGSGASAGTISPTEALKPLGELAKEEYTFLHDKDKPLDFQRLRDEVNAYAERQKWTREWQIRSVLLSFYDLSCQYVSQKGSITVLAGASGSIPPGSLVAMMGPSGAGKSTLLDILAMRKTVGQLSGVITVNGNARDPATFRSLSAYVAQEDTFLPTLSVKETLQFYIQLRLGSLMTAAEKAERLERLLEEVGLAAKRDSMVGGQLVGGLSVRGLSGGERRRLSICCGAVAKPSLLFLDEPTSGLDAMSSLLVMDLMKSYTSRGVSVISTIHQPRREILELFDKVMLLSQGRMLYNGPTSGALPWFQGKLDYPMPAVTSLSDYLLDLVNVSFNKTSTLFGDRTMRTTEDVDVAAKAFATNKEILETRRYSVLASLINARLFDPLNQEPPPSSSPLCMPVEFQVLVWRSFLSYLRNPGNVAARFLVYVMVAIIHGAAFYQLADDAVTSRLGSLFFGLIVNSLLPFCSMSLFIYDRTFFSKDSAAGLYRSFSYYLATMILESLLTSIIGFVYAVITYFMVGAVTGDGTFGNYAGTFVLHNVLSTMWVQLCAITAPNQDVGFVAGAGYTAASFLLCGFLVSYNDLGAALSWGEWLAFLKYSFQALAINEFEGTPYQATLIEGTLDLDRPSTVAKNLGALCAFFPVFATCSLLSLTYLYREKR